MVVVMLLVMFFTHLGVLALGVLQLVSMVLGFRQPPFLQHYQILAQGAVRRQRRLLRNQPKRFGYATVPDTLSLDVEVTKVGSKHSSRRLSVLGDGSYEIVCTAFWGISELRFEVQTVLLISNFYGADG